MRKRKLNLYRILSVAFLLSFLVGSAGAVPNPEQRVPVFGVEYPNHPEFIPGDLLVKFKPETATLAANKLMETYQASYVRTLYGIPTQLWQVPEGMEAEIATRLSADPNIEYADLNYIYHEIATIPNDPDFAKQWAYTTTNAIHAWNISTGISVTIAILDSGIDETHPDLAGKIWVNADESITGSDSDGNGFQDDTWGWDFVGNDNAPHDGRGHGTLVSGIAAAATNNATGVAGMSWGALIMPIRVLNNNGVGTTDNVAEGMAYACDNGAKIINLSFATPSGDATLADAVSLAHDNECLVVAGAGNSRKDGNPTQYPAGYESTIAVAATGYYDNYAYYSQYGSHIDVAAPGGDTVGIYSTMPTYTVTLNSAGYTQTYSYGAGTSASTAFVSGLAALIWSIEPTLTMTDVRTIIETTAVDKGSPGWDPDYGHGRINALAALQMAAGYSNIYIPLVLNDYTSGSGWTHTIIEDFEGDFPASWVVTQTIPGSGEYFWSQESVRPCEIYGGYASGWAVGGGADGSGLLCGSNYPDNIDAEMVFGPFSLADVSQAYLTFQIWLNSEFDSIAKADYFRYRFSKDGVNFAGWRDAGSSYGWEQYWVDFSSIPIPGGGGAMESYIGEENVWIQFRFTSDGSINELDGVFIDDIILHTCSTDC